MFNVKFSYNTQFIFGSLTFVTGQNENFKMLPPRPAPEHLSPVYGQTLCLSAISSTSDGACSGLNPYTGPYIHTAKLVRGFPIVTSILQPSIGALSSSSSATSPDQDSTDDYPEIGGSTYWDSTEEGRLIIMVAPTGALHTRTPVYILPSGDQKRSMPGRPMMA
jgi:hypothetical protein